MAVLPASLSSYTGQLKYVGSHKPPVMDIGSVGFRFSVPFQVLCDRLPLRALLDLASAHAVSVPRSSRTLFKLTKHMHTHTCTANCRDMVYHFQSVDAESMPPPTVRFVPYVSSASLQSVVEACATQTSSVIEADLLVRFSAAFGSPSPPSNIRCVFVGHLRTADVHVALKVPQSYALNVPLLDLMPLLSYRLLIVLAESHQIFIPTGMRTHRAIASLLAGHSCSDMCGKRTAVFRSVDVVAPPKAPLSAVAPDVSRIASTKTDVHVFPPEPFTCNQFADLVDDWCNATDYSSLAEGACAICGESIKKSRLRRVALDAIDVAILCRDGISLASGEPILFRPAVYNVDGIVYIDSCTTCLEAVKARRLPKRSLANGLWVGDIPNVLRDLTFVEKMVVSKYRHNACVVKVKQGNGLPGQRRMRANAIIFPQPVGRVYSELPPPWTELDAVLAILFVGPCVPVESDFRRTPLLIRHDVVVKALAWLIENHCDYGGISISYVNLQTYPESQPPVCVIHRTSDGLRTADTMAVFDTDGKDGAATGPCEFVVHGVSASELVDMSYNAKVGHAIKHFDSGNPMLAFGHSESPASMYHNSALFPGLFPWLFPYGLGGFENSHITTQISRTEHIRHLLLYADRRFQTDEYFPLIVFNQEQIRGSNKGGFLLTKRNNFASVTQKILSIDRDALQSLLDRGAKGEYLKPETPEEKQCFELLSVVDLVANHVPASNAQRKIQRSEIKSIILSMGVPVFFITFAPADFKSPLCMYYCGEQIDLLSHCPTMPSSQDRMRAVASNPVACARFFHAVVELFTAHILRSGTDKSGLFGPTRAYYGTVEAQGRLSLHLHLLVWIHCSLSPQTIRDRVLDDLEFRQRLLSWLEQCHQGDFSTGTTNDIRDRLSAQNKDRVTVGSLSVDITPSMELTSSTGMDSVMTLPIGPPPLHIREIDSTATERWFKDVLRISDEIVYRSNRHCENHSRGCKRPGQSVCRARFPREVLGATTIDPSTGAIQFKKTEPWINTFHPVLSYLLRCNSDVTCLLSRTQVRAVIAYVTDYITKSAYKMHDAFGSVKAVVERMDDIVVNSEGNHDAARSVVVKIVNALSAMQQVGGPMACAYLLGNPDHYTDQRFKTFYWKAYVRYADATSSLHVPLAEADDDDDDRVGLTMSGDDIVPYYRVNNYVYQPHHFNSMCLYDYFSNTVQQKSLTAADDRDSSPSLDTNEPNVQHIPHRRRLHKLLATHPLVKTHVVYSLEPADRFIPNFVGPVLPRPDVGDRLDYCRTMLVLFKPDGWRTGDDIVGRHCSWEEAFNSTIFQPEHQQIMRNMNVLYECLDARDDYSALQRQQEKEARSLEPGGGEVAGPDTLLDALACQVPSEFDLDSIEGSMVNSLSDPSLLVGEAASIAQSKMDNMIKYMSRMYGVLPESVIHSGISDGNNTAQFSPALSSTYWKSRMAIAKALVLESRRKPLSAPVLSSSAVGHAEWTHTVDLVSVVNSDFFVTVLNRFNLYQSVGPQDTTLELMHRTVEMFSLNEEQVLAFGIIARQMHLREPKALRMYLGGIGGTGKSTVLRSILYFLAQRGESNRLVVLAPTGTAACNVDGQTYHSALGFTRTSSADGSINLTALSKKRTDWDGVEAAVVDEVSMLSCTAVYKISSQMCKIAGVAGESFGGKSIIFCGDFAQLPPPGVGQVPLYSSGVYSKQKTSHIQSQAAQGRALWAQFTTVVILRKNMRQRGSSAGDNRFRTALENMCYRSCTKDDIELLSSRIVASSSSAPSLKHDTFRNVSVITAYNVDRDAMNACGAVRFAREHRRQLHYFHSIDTWPLTADTLDSVSQQRRRCNNNILRGPIGASAQQILWDLPPHCTNHHAGVLPLCIGMPVLLKVNEATELCATNGAEATVVGWNSHVQADHEVLDTLFIRLTSPARSVNIEGLQENVIPLTRHSSRVKMLVSKPCSFLRWDREQIPILLNFVMTDFGAQGKTRPYNPCHLSNCRNHQSIYTCLSRSSSLDGTMILGTPDWTKVTGGCSGPLMQEFMELEILDVITALKAQGKLPAHVSGADRRSLLQSWADWKGPNYIPPNAHPALVSFIRQQSSLPRSAKRELDESDCAATPAIPASKRAKTSPLTALTRERSNDSVEYYSPRGLKWDSVNWSCAYDAVLSVLINAVLSSRSSEVWKIAYSVPMTTLLSYTREATSHSLNWLQIRTDIRSHLHSVAPSLFPYGPSYASAGDVMLRLVEDPYPFGLVERSCPSCGLTEEGSPLTQLYIPIFGRHRQLITHAPFPDAAFIQATLTSHMADNRSCIQCQSSVTVSLCFLRSPTFLLLEFQDVGSLPTCFNLAKHVDLVVSGHTCHWRLVGTIYIGSNHFTSRFIDSLGCSWYHDGQTTGLACLRESATTNLREAMGRELTLAVYMVSEDSGR